MKSNYFFDNAATTWPKPEAVYRFMDSFYRSHGVNPGRSGYQLAVEAEQMITETRRMLTQFFNCGGDADRMIFTANATDSLNLALFGLVKTGDHIVTTRLEHNAVLRPLNHLQRDHGVAVTYVPGDAKGVVDPENIRRAITPKTRAIVVNHASNVLGTVQDIVAIGKIAREAGATFIVDTCQTAGVVPIDMQAANINVLTWTGHKGLFGPMGIGGMFVCEQTDIAPRKVGGTGVDSISPFQPEKYPFHLETGTGPLPAVAGLNAAQKWLAELGREGVADANPLSHAEACRRGIERVHHHEMALVKRLLDAISATPGITVYGPTTTANRVATVSLNIRDMPADQVGAILDGDFHICVRTGLHCAPLVHEDAGTVDQKGTVRFAPGYFTTADEIDHAIAAITEIASWE